MNQAPDSSPPPAEASPALLNALRMLMRPVVRLLLSRQIGYPFFSNFLKGIFVDVAVHDVPLAGKRQTDSRLSLLTGVHRKDVRRLLSEDAGNTPPAVVSLGGRLIARWNGESDYLDTEGQPRPLPRLAQADDGPSFERLVSEVSKDIRPRAVLDEWLRLGIAELDDDDRVCLCTGAFVPSAGDDEKLYFLGRNARDHLATAVHNVSGDGPPRLERAVYADGLSPAAIAELQALAEQLGMDMLRTLNQRARELKRSQPPADNSQRMTLGVYFHSEPAPRENADAPQA